MLLPLLPGEETYRLARGYKPETVAAALRYGAPAGCCIEHHAQLPRCMDRMTELIASAAGRGECLPCGTVVLADQLEQGRGRFSRDWFAPPGGAWLTLAWSDCLLPQQLRLLPLAAGVACCETLRDYGIDARVKWVNDVHVGGRKIAGVLCETRYGSRPEDIYHCIGVGINVNNEHFPRELLGIATSLRQQSGETVDLNRLRLLLLIKLRWNIGLLHVQEASALAAALDVEAEVAEDSSPLFEVWGELSDTIGRRVEYGFDVQQKPAYQATALGLDPMGGLVLSLDDGTKITEYAGEIRYLD